MSDPRRGRAYARFRTAVIARDGGRCLNCGSTEALEVDHVIPITDAPERALDASNVQTLCRRCNRRKGPAHIDYRHPTRVRSGAIVVTGPPGSGKSWYVEAHRGEEDRVVDFDLLARAVGSRDLGNDHAQAHAEFALVAWDALVGTALASGGRTWVVHATPTPSVLAGYRAAGAAIVSHIEGGGVGVFSAATTSGDTSTRLSLPTPREPGPPTVTVTESGQAATERARARWGVEVTS